MPVVDGLPVPVVRWHVAPRQPAAGPPEHPVDHRPVVGPTTAPLRLLAGQQRLQPGPFLIGQIVSIEHSLGLPHPLIKIRGTRSRPSSTISTTRWATSGAVSARPAGTAITHSATATTPAATATKA